MSKVTADPDALIDYDTKVQAKVQDARDDDATAYSKIQAMNMNSDSAYDVMPPSFSVRASLDSAESLAATVKRIGQSFRQLDRRGLAEVDELDLARAYRDLFPNLERFPAFDEAIEHDRIDRLAETVRTSNDVEEVAAAIAEVDAYGRSDLASRFLNQLGGSDLTQVILDLPTRLDPEACEETVTQLGNILASATHDLPYGARGDGLDDHQPGAFDYALIRELEASDYGRNTLRALTSATTRPFASGAAEDLFRNLVNDSSQVEDGWYGSPQSHHVAGTSGDLGPLRALANSKEATWRILSEEGQITGLMAHQTGDPELEAELGRAFETYFLDARGYDPATGVSSRSMYASLTELTVAAAGNSYGDDLTMGMAAAADGHVDWFIDRSNDSNPEANSDQEALIESFFASLSTNADAVQRVLVRADVERRIRQTAELDLGPGTPGDRATDPADLRDLNEDLKAFQARILNGCADGSIEEEEGFALAGVAKLAAAIAIAGGTVLIPATGGTSAGIAIATAGVLTSAGADAVIDEAKRRRDGSIDHDYDAGVDPYVVNYDYDTVALAAGHPKWKDLLKDAAGVKVADLEATVLRAETDDVTRDQLKRWLAEQDPQIRDLVRG